MSAHPSPAKRTPPTMDSTSDPAHVSLHMQIERTLQQAISLQGESPSRELSLTVTKLEEAALWISKKTRTAPSAGSTPPSLEDADPITLQNAGALEIPNGDSGT